MPTATPILVQGPAAFGLISLTVLDMPLGSGSAGIINGEVMTAVTEKMLASDVRTRGRMATQPTQQPQDQRITLQLSHIQKTIQTTLRLTEILPCPGDWSMGDQGEKEEWKFSTEMNGEAFVMMGLG